MIGKVGDEIIRLTPAQEPRRGLQLLLGHWPPGPRKQRGKKRSRDESNIWSRTPTIMAIARARDGVSKGRHPPSTPEPRLTKIKYGPIQGKAHPGKEIGHVFK